MGATGVLVIADWAVAVARGIGETTSEIVASGELVLRIDGPVETQAVKTNGISRINLSIDLTAWN